MLDIKKPYLLFTGDAKYPNNAKTAVGIARFRPDDCLGYIKLPEGVEVLPNLPELTIAEAKSGGAKTLVLGQANSGGYIAKEWVPTIVAAIKAGFDIASGLHERLEEIPEVLEAGERHQVKLHNVRHYTGKLTTGNAQKRSGKRLLTVGTDCSVGKMTTSLILEQELIARGHKTKFVATGQTGILIAGSGISVDAVVSDFISGAVEMLSPATEEDCYTLIEGQGSLFHPSFAGVTLGLLHGAQADYLVVCHDPTRKTIRHIPSHKMPSVQETIALNLNLGALTNPNIKAVGISVNSSEMSVTEAQDYIKKLEAETGLPTTDPYRFGVSNIVDNLLIS